MEEMMKHPTRNLSVESANVIRRMQSMVLVARRDMPSPTQQSLLLM
jgi:hypothetical protein